VESIRHASPSLVEAALAMLLQYVDTGEQEQNESLTITPVPILFAPYLNAATIVRCTEAGVNCVDAVGNGRVVLSTRTYIERMGQPEPTERLKARASLFTPKAERVLRVLLNAVGAIHYTWRVQPLAEEAQVSIGQVARIKDALHERGFIAEDSTVRHHGGFHLTHPEELLKEWATFVRTKRNRQGVAHTYHAVDSVMELKRMLNRKIPNHYDKVALSGLSAADQYAPYVVSPRFTAYIIEEGEVTLELMEEALDLQSVESGVNVVLTIPHDEGVLYLPKDIRDEFKESLAGVQPVSPIQAYLDMQSLGGRAEEGAQHLLEEYLRPRWHKS
ncbi:MAG: type IV toxin-antitoxin system AbiEi family antitoxin, partial [Armatimonadetes bacterium]|nr:type IV toxin-antitoxin system AbiEi family antitoxin [Armatimonadota bacterium]